MFNAFELAYLQSRDSVFLIKKNGIKGLEAVKIFFDCFYCRIKFHCKPKEYFFYEFYNLSDRERKNYLLVYEQRIGYLYITKPGYRLSNKMAMLEAFSDIAARKWLDVSTASAEELAEFVNTCGRIVLKPDCASQGRGVLSVTAPCTVEQAAALLRQTKGEVYIAEEYIKQCAEMARLCPTSVNTTRILSFNDGSGARIIGAGLRTGNGGICDNMSAGGIGAEIDVETGIVCSVGVDFEKRRYMHHPVSGTQIIGFKIPFWQQAKETVLAAANTIPDCAVVGWDIAYGENGPIFVELNNNPGNKLIQSSSGKPAGAEIKAYIKQNKKKYPENYRALKKHRHKYY